MKIRLMENKQFLEKKNFKRFPDSGLLLHPKHNVQVGLWQAGQPTPGLLPDSPFSLKGTSR